MRIGVPREICEGEKRVAATPETVDRLIKLGHELLIESSAGALATYSDEAYAEVGATIIDDPQSVWGSSDMILKVRPPDVHPSLGVHEASMLKEGAVLISFLWPSRNPDLLGQLQARRASAFAVDMIPRISRAQKMDALSSMANIAGYRAVIEAAHLYGRFFTGQITAAGRIPPTKVMVIGAGVAGLAAIAAAKGLGAIVRAFDTRLAVKEQIHSLGAEFLELDFKEDGAGQGGYGKVMSPEFIAAEMALFAKQALEVDIIVTTALIPGVAAPKLITEGMVDSMKPGSVIIDLAAEQGGNCVLTRPGEVVVHRGVFIVGYTDMPSRLPVQASQLYGTNLYHFIAHLHGKDGFRLDLSDDIVRTALATHAGEITWPPPAMTSAAQGGETAPKAASTQAKPAAAAVPAKQSRPLLAAGWRIAVVLLLVVIGSRAPADFLSHFTVFVLACIVGWMVVWNVKPALHTPLMSVTNAVSGIIIIGGMVQLSQGGPFGVTTALAATAVLVGTMNVVGGFLVTQRMLKMFRK